MDPENSAEEQFFCERAECRASILRIQYFDGWAVPITSVKTNDTKDYGHVCSRTCATEKTIIRPCHDYICPDAFPIKSLIQYMPLGVNLYVITFILWRHGSATLQV